MEVIRATEEWQRAGVHYVRVEGMMKEYPFPLSAEFCEDTPQDEYVLALDGTFPVGTCRLHVLDGQTAKIERVVVIPDYRGKGVGSLVIREAERWLKEKGIKKIRIHSRLCATPFYEKLGYTTNYEEIEGTGDFQLVYTEKELV